jgi:Patatin-like phospholipase
MEAVAPKLSCGYLRLLTKRGLFSPGLPLRKSKEGRPRVSSAFWSASVNPLLSRASAGANDEALLLRRLLHSDASTAKTRVSSIGFSGAGFLAAYHLGVAACLLKYDVLPPAGVKYESDKDLTGDCTIFAASPFENDYHKKRYPWLPLTGVSAGAIVASAILAGVHPERGMDAILQVAGQARNAGRWDSFTPGFSLVDAFEHHLSTLLREATYHDEEFLLKHRYDDGRLLRIGLTDRRIFPPMGQNPAAICHVRRYGGYADVIAACILSSYVPGITGPIFGSHQLLSPLQSRTKSVDMSRYLQHPVLASLFAGLPTLRAHPVRNSANDADSSAISRSSAAKSEARERRGYNFAASSQSNTTTRTNSTSAKLSRKKATVENTAVRRAWKQLEQMIRKHQAVVYAAGDVPVRLEIGRKGTGALLNQNEGRSPTPTLDPWNDSEEYESRSGDTTREICWDGGLVNAFPVFDNYTVIVSPLEAAFPFHSSITPSIAGTSSSDDRAISTGYQGKVLRLNEKVHLHLNSANAKAFASLLISSEDAVLERWYQEGYDHATLWCRNHLQANRNSIAFTPAGS